MPDRTTSKIRDDAGYKLVRCRIDTTTTAPADSATDSAVNAVRETLTPPKIGPERVIDAHVTGTEQTGDDTRHHVRVTVDLPLAANSDVADDELVARAQKKIADTDLTFVDGTVTGWDHKFRSTAHPDSRDTTDE